MSIPPGMRAYLAREHRPALPTTTRTCAGGGGRLALLPSALRAIVLDAWPTGLSGCECGPGDRRRERRRYPTMTEQLLARRPELFAPAIQTSSIIVKGSRKVEHRRESPQIGRSAPQLGEIGPHVAKIPPCSVEFEPNFGRCRPSMTQVGQIQPSADKSWPKRTEASPKSTKFGRNLAQIGSNRSLGRFSQATL